MSYITRKLHKFTEKETYVHFWKTLKYAFHIIFHPADGFWDLIHEKRGSYGAATFILLMTLLARVWQIQFTSFLVQEIQWAKINIFMECATILFPFAIFCICNWGTTTLFDGKGHLGEIYMGTAYALTPYPLIQIPLIVISNFLNMEEIAFYDVFVGLALVWCLILIFMAMMMIHQYSAGKTLLFCIITVFAMLIFIFIMLLFFSMISQGVAYFVSLAKEIMFRLN